MSSQLTKWLLSLADQTEEDPVDEIWSTVGNCWLQLTKLVQHNQILLGKMKNSSKVTLCPSMWAFVANTIFVLVQHSSFIFLTKSVSQSVVLLLRFFPILVWVDFFFILKPTVLLILYLCSFPQAHDGAFISSCYFWRSAQKSKVSLQIDKLHEFTNTGLIFAQSNEENIQLSPRLFVAVE